MLKTRPYLRIVRARWPRMRMMATVAPKGPGADAANQANATAARDKDSNEHSTVETNAKTQTNRLEKTLAKFWEQVTCQETPNGFRITLDGKPIRTPLGNEMTIPKNKPTLAYLLTNEWKSLPSLKVRPYLLPLTSLASRAIDLQAPESKAKAKIGDMKLIKKLLLRYLDTDTLLVFSPKKDCDGKLRTEQEKLYRPVIKSMEKYLGTFTENGQPVKLNWLDTETTMSGNSQSDEVVKAANKFLDSLDMWQLVALERTTLTCKSFLSGVAVVRINDRKDDFDYSLEQLAYMATLETLLQQEQWGEVEDTHDVEKVDVRRHLASSSILCYTK